MVGLVVPLSCSCGRKLRTVEAWVRLFVVPHIVVLLVGAGRCWLMITQMVQCLKLGEAELVDDRNHHMTWIGNLVLFSLCILENMEKLHTAKQFLNLNAWGSDHVS